MASGQAIASYRERSLSEFVEPWQLPPIVLDGSCRVTVVEGRMTPPPTDEEVGVVLATIAKRVRRLLRRRGLFDSRFDVVRCQSLMLFFRLAAALKIAFGLRSACSDHVHLSEILQANPES